MMMTMALAALAAGTACDDDNPEEMVGTWRAYQATCQVTYSPSDGDEQTSELTVTASDEYLGITWYLYSDGRMLIIETMGFDFEYDDEGCLTVVLDESVATMESTTWSLSGDVFTIGDSYMTVTSQTSATLTVESYETDGDYTTYLEYTLYKTG